MTTIRLRGGSATEWANVNPVLAEREIGLDLTNNNFRVGDGTNAWSALTDWITGGGGATAIDWIILQDQKSIGVNGGDFISGAWRTRDINTILHDDTGLVTINANQFTLPIGSYVFLSFCPCFRVARNKSRLYSISSSMALGESVNQFSDTSGATTTTILICSFQISSSEIFEVQHYCATTKTTNGFGTDISFGDSEVYTTVIIGKLD